MRARTARHFVVAPVNVCEPLVPGLQQARGRPAHGLQRREEAHLGQPARPPRPRSTAAPEPANKSQKCCPAVPTVLTARVTDPGNKIKMPEMATEAVDAVALLFEAYKKEHKSSTLTLPQFRQVRAPCPGGGLPLCSSHALPM